ncbi:MAG: hypothetical protein P1Q69_09985 [Candidatus Thorarchaeota archaeon]|nr:hypothetical protein [Candidatus Thorarchaeota archaeon]
MGTEESIILWIVFAVRRLNFGFFYPSFRVITIQAELIDPEDLVLIGVESLIVLGVLIALVIAFLVRSRHPKLSQGWNFIILGLVFILLHGIFDVLDTMQFDSLVVDVLNVFDGATFLIGLLLFALGIYRIAEYGAKQWGLE